MKIYSKALIFISTILLLATNASAASASEDFLIQYENKNYSYEEFWLKNYEENGGYSKQVYDAAFIELKNILDKIEKIEDSAMPDQSIKQFILQNELGEFIENFGCCGGSNYLLEISDRLRSAGYPISDDEINNPNNVNFKRGIYPEKLINIAKEYPNTDYEKEALFLIATKTPLNIYFSNANVDEENIFLLRPLIWKLQATNLFIEKYSKDNRIEEIRNINKSLSEFYIQKNENNFDDEIIDHYYQLALNNENFCLSGDATNCKIGKLPIFSKKIIKKPLDTIMKDEIGKIETRIVINNPFNFSEMFEKQKRNFIILILSIGILIASIVSYVFVKKSKK